MVWRYVMLSLSSSTSRNYVDQVQVAAVVTVKVVVGIQYVYVASSEAVVAFLVPEAVVAFVTRNIHLLYPDASLVC